MYLAPCKQFGGLVSSDPFRDLEEHFGRLFNNPNAFLSSTTGLWKPAVDIRETDDTYVVDVDIPGMRKEDVRVEVLNDVLTLSGEREQEDWSEEKGYRRVERRYGNFRRSVKLPGEVDAEKVTGVFKEGVLEVTLPKRESAKSKVVAIS